MKKILGGVLVLFLIAGGASAVNYSGKAGCAIDSQGLSIGTTVKDSDEATALLPTGTGGSTALVEYISVGVNNRIDGPSGAGAMTADDTLVLSRNVGESDLVPFSGQAGHFWYGISGTLNGVKNNFIVRAWNKTKTDTDAYFGESGEFACNTSSIGFPAPDDNPLSTFSTVFPKAPPLGLLTARADDPAWNGNTVRWNSCFGARRYLVYQTDASGNILSTVHDQYNTFGRCSTGNTGAMSFNWTGLRELTAY